MTLSEFVSLSVVLTGYPEEKLFPKQDTQKVAQEYFKKLTTAGLIPGNALAELTAAWNAIQTQPASQHEVLVKQNIINNPAIGRLAKNIIYMWYLAIWYDLYVEPGTYPNKDSVVSSNAYRNSLVWETMGAHPMGFSEDTFGYWKTAPASI